LFGFGNLYAHVLGNVSPAIWVRTTNNRHILIEFVFWAYGIYRNLRHNLWNCHCWWNSFCGWNSFWNSGPDRIWWNGKYWLFS
jgi:hypothetical protein